MQQPRSLISIDQLTDDDLRGLVERGVHFGRRDGANDKPLDGRIVGIYFRNTSTRTRTAFSSGALRLGAQIISYGPDDLQTKTGESIEDTARVFGSMLDMLVIRSAASADEAGALAAAGSLSVINAMSAVEHPTQALADLTTISEHFGRLTELSVLYVGEGNNTAIALALALPRLKAVRLEFRTPEGYGLPPDVLRRAAAAAQLTNSTVVEHHHMDDLPPNLDVIYTTRWQTTGSSKPDADWRTRFAPFQVTEALWRQSPDAVFMHDLPAHRGEEVAAEVLDGPRSIAFRQARNKLYSAMAVLEWAGAAVAPTLEGDGGRDV
jgi:ornithine carbamoyltransferase